jgi:hypothetical protein
MDIEKIPTAQPADEAAVEPKLLSREYDVANQILADAAQFADEEFTPEEDKRLRWKIDWHLIPIVRISLIPLQQKLACLLKPNLDDYLCDSERS